MNFLLRVNIREIGDVNEGVVERSEDTGNAKDEFTYMEFSLCCSKIGLRINLPSRT